MTRPALLALTILASATSAYADDFSDGWCAGYRQAVTSLQQNRTRWRKRVGLPAEATENSLKRIYATPWDQQHKDGPTIVDNTVAILGDTVDLYLMLPDLKPGLMILPDGRRTECK